jgi:histone acetyltransferase 1
MVGSLLNSLLLTTVDSFENKELFKAKLKNTESVKTFKPPGRLVSRYELRGKSFELWGSDLTDPNARNLLNRVQIFVSLLIEGGTPISFDDPEWSLKRWTVYFLYVKHNYSYVTDFKKI